MCKNVSRTIRKLKAPFARVRQQKHKAPAHPPQLGRTSCETQHRNRFKVGFRNRFNTQHNAASKTSHVLRSEALKIIGRGSGKHLATSWSTVDIRFPIMHNNSRKAVNERAAGDRAQHLAEADLGHCELRGALAALYRVVFVFICGRRVYLWDLTRGTLACQRGCSRMVWEHTMYRGR